VGPRITWPYNQRDKSRREPGPNREAVDRNLSALFFRTVTDPQAVEDPLGLVNLSTPQLHVIGHDII